MGSSRPSMRYAAIVADPPWPIVWTAGRWRRNGRGEVHNNGKRALDYQTMTVDEIAALPINELAEADAHLYLWTPDRWLIDGDAARIARAWGFSPLRLIVWHKPSPGLGHFPRPAHESVIVCRRGSLPFRVGDVPSVQKWNRPTGWTHVHSSKPDAFLDLVEQASPGPYLELFARRNRFGWDTWGNESLELAEVASGR